MMAAVSPADLCLRLFSHERTSHILIMNQPQVHCAIVVGSHWPQINLYRSVLSGFLLCNHGFVLFWPH